MKIRVFDGYFRHGYVTMDVSFWQWLKLQVGWEGIYAFQAQPEGYTAPHDFYVVHCGRHGFYLDCLHGFEGYNQGFDCPFCLKEIGNPTEEAFLEDYGDC